jgi:hypothetical protein
MKKETFLLAAMVCLIYGATAQKKPPAAVNALLGNVQAKEDKTGSFTTGKAVRILQIQIPDGGANGAAVVYHPKEKLYYAAQAGNSDFPLVIFNESGEIVSQEGQSTLIDVRGMWYNPKTKTIGGNGYKDFGWFRYELNKNGFPESIDIFKKGSYQPDDHSAGVLNTDENEIIFLSDLNLLCYTTEGADKNKVIKLHFGSKSPADDANFTSDDFYNNYNTKSIIYTGKKGEEIGLLNVTKMQAELYNKETGYMSRTVSLPLDFTPESFFNFSYSNDTYWVFNKKTRVWNGYKEQ